MTNKSTSRIPKYVEIREDIKFKILGAEWKPGDRILSEEEYCEYYSVSRITVRKALADLESQGFLIKQSGKGTFVTKWQDTQYDSLDSIKSFTNDMRERGRKPISLSVKVTVEYADRQIAGYLNIEKGDRIIKLHRLRAVDENEIIAYSINSFPWREEFSINPDDYWGSLYEYLSKFGIYCHTYKEYAEAQLPSKEIAKLLKIKQHDPILKSVIISQNTQGTFREHNLCYYIGSKYRLYIKT